MANGSGYETSHHGGQTEGPCSRWILTCLSSIQFSTTVMWHFVGRRTGTDGRGLVSQTASYLLASYVPSILHILTSSVRTYYYNSPSPSGPYIRSGGEGLVCMLALHKCCVYVCTCMCACIWFLHFYLCVSQTPMEWFTHHFACVAWHEHGMFSQFKCWL